MRKITIAALAILAAGVWLAVRLEPAATTDPVRAIGETGKLPASLGRALDPSAFRVLGPPGPHDWLANHPEPGQTCDQFARGGYNKPDEARKTIYLQPIGRFEPGRSPKLADLAECARAYFTLPVEVLDPLSLESGKLTTRINSYTKNRQVLATEVLEWLERRLPGDAFCLLGVTMEDLYPEPSWNFVFGMASIRERVGVFSFTRYDPAFYGEPRGPDYQQVLIRRSCKVLTHETGHMFGLYHCIYYECGMNGSNHLDESDSRPIHLCPVCLRKLHHAIGFEVVERYKKLQAFYRRVGLADEAAWVGKRLKRIQRK